MENTNKMKQDSLCTFTRSNDIIKTDFHSRRVLLRFVFFLSRSFVLDFFSCRCWRRHLPFHLPHTEQTAISSSHIASHCLPSICRQTITIRVQSVSHWPRTSTSHPQHSHTPPQSSVTLSFIRLITFGMSRLTRIGLHRTFAMNLICTKWHFRMWRLHQPPSSSLTIYTHTNDTNHHCYEVVVVVVIMVV